MGSFRGNKRSGGERRLGCSEVQKCRQRTGDWNSVAAASAALVAFGTHPPHRFAFPLPLWAFSFGRSTRLMCFESQGWSSSVQGRLGDRPGGYIVSGEYPLRACAPRSWVSVPLCGHQCPPLSQGRGLRRTQSQGPQDEQDWVYSQIFNPKAGGVGCPP